MKKIFISILLLFFSAEFILAQPTQAEIDRMMKQAQEMAKKYGTDSARNKEMKGIQDQQKQVTDAMKNQPTKNNGPTSGSLYPDPSEYGNVDNWKFPAKNTALLSSLPKKIFSRAELVSFLNDIYLQLSKKLPAGVSSSVQSMATKYKNDGSKMGDAAVLGWYSNYREESLLLIVKAAANNPDNGLLLNNCAAILNMSGIEEKAIPVLKYILQSYPSNGMVLNNLGQAYAGLGETDTAMVYLGRCIKVQPENSEANNTAGQIEATKGNTEKAAAYFEQSIKRAYSEPAELKLKKIKKDSKIVPLVRPRVKIPEYFNQFKYQLPAQCTNTGNAVLAEAEHKAFRATIEKQFNIYGAKLGELGPRLLVTSPLQSRVMKKGEFMAQPFHEFCGIMSGEITADYMKELGDLTSRVDKKYYADMTSLENEYQSKYKAIEKAFADREKPKCCGEGNTSCCISEEERCSAYNGLANQYLPQFAALTEDWQQKNQLVFKKYFDEMIYWGYLVYHPLGNDYFRLNCFYPHVTQYLLMLGKIAYTKIIHPCHFEPTTASKDSNALKEMDCPLDIKIPFVVGKFELNCDKFTLSGGEVVVFSYEKNFKTKQSTVEIGVGANLELGVKAGPVKGGVSVGADESFFITFDGNNGISDAGIKYEAGAAVGAKAGDVIKKGESTSIGYTVGINSGWNFNEGPFKGMVGPAPEVQQNKNVKIYKPN